jgi:predicted transcriptional regulator of viral defense system
MVLIKDNYRLGLSKKETFLLSSMAKVGKGVFTIKEAVDILGKDAKRTMSSLIRKKWILPLKRGLYAIVPLDIGVKGAESFILHDFVAASYMAEPYYVGFWSALNYHGLSDQIPGTVFIATTKARPPLRVQNSWFRFVQLTKNRFVGSEKVEIDGREVEISDKEKTIVDCLDHPEHAGGIDEVAKAIFFGHEELDRVKVHGYALMMRNNAIFKRLGYLLEKTDLFNAYKSLFEGIRLTTGYSALDKGGARAGKYNERWKLFINADIDAKRWMY